MFGDLNTNNTKGGILQYILSGAFIFAILTLASVAYLQHSSLESLKQQVSEIQSTTLNIEHGNQLAFNLGLMESQETQSKKSILKNHDIIGEVKDLTPDSLTIETKIDDITKIDQYDESKNELFPQTIKKYKVIVNDATIFTSMKINELKVGDWVSVQSKNSIYHTSEFVEFVATSISVVAK